MNRLKVMTKGGQKAVKMNYLCLILAVLLFSCDKKDNDKVQPDDDSINPVNASQGVTDAVTWVTVSGGTYEMGCKEDRDDINNLSCDGDEKPVHSVSVGSFKMSAYEVTNAQYAKFLNAIGVDPSGTYSKGGAYENKEYINISSRSCRIDYVGGRFVAESGYENHPVVHVSWVGARNYCKWVGGRLPTEEEWEYAARGGNKSKGKGYQFAGSDDIDQVAWYDGNSGNKTHVVGRKSANELGLYDMSGNVWEWCESGYGSYNDKLSERSGRGRVIRGGSWSNSAMSVRVSYRIGNNLPAGNNYYGFRPVLDLPLPLVFPETGSEVKNDADGVTFFWEGVEGVDEYELFVGDSADGLTSRGKVSGTRKTLTELVGDATYYWNVEGLSGTGDDQQVIAKSATWSFELVEAWVTVAGGTYEMGCKLDRDDINGYKCKDNEKPLHSVTVESFKMSAYEVTNAQYAKFLNAVEMDADGTYRGNGSYDGAQSISISSSHINYENGRFVVKNGYEKHPVVHVSWVGARNYCKWVGGRLPTEEEWEYAARGGNKSKGYQFAGSNDIDEVAWYSSNSGRKTHVVGGKRANELGLYDMSGNVWEWCSSKYGSYNDNSSDRSDSVRVLRGGGWFGIKRISRVSYRNRLVSLRKLNAVGFRPVIPFVAKGETISLPLVSPETGSKVKNDADGVTFFWEGVEGVDEYELFVGDSADGLTSRGKVSGTRKTLTELVGDATYYWRVDGFSGTGSDQQVIARSVTWLFEELVEAGLTWVTVAGGTYEMGCKPGRDDINGYKCKDNEKPLHSVAVSSFKMSAYEVTNAQYAKFLNAVEMDADGTYRGNGSYDGGQWQSISIRNSRINYTNKTFVVESGYENHPVVHVSWVGARNYAKWVGGRLPSEEEWEYAARGGASSKGYQFAGSDDIDQVAWYDGNSDSKTHSVGQKLPNELGLYDMSGNVWEWCESRWSDNYNSTRGTGEWGARARVLRGGSWDYNARNARVSRRNAYYQSNNMNFNLGFRPVLSLP